MTEINGLQDVVSFRTTASKILQDFHGQNAQQKGDERHSIIEAAAKFIKHNL